MRVKLRKATHKEWLDHAQADERATFFQTPFWLDVWKKYAGYTNASVFFQLENDKSGVFPLAARRTFRGLNTEYFASPGGTYGGPVSAFVLDEVEKRDVEQAIFRNCDFVYRRNPFHVPTELASSKYISDSTHLIKLGEVEIDNISGDWRKGHKADAKRAIREGVEIEVTRDWGDLNEYYSVYLHSVERWGDKASSFYTFEIFKYLFELSTDNVRLWKAVYNNRLVYGCLCFYHNNHVVYWHGAGLSEFFKIGSVHALQLKIIEDAKKRNYKYYDFNPSGGHVGVERFKDGFGALKVSSDVHIGLTVKKNMLTRIAKFLK